MDMREDKLQAFLHDLNNFHSLTAININIGGCIHSLDWNTGLAGF